MLSASRSAKVRAGMPCPCAHSSAKRAKNSLSPGPSSNWNGLSLRSAPSAAERWAPPAALKGISRLRSESKAKTEQPKRSKKNVKAHSSVVFPAPVAPKAKVWPTVFSPRASRFGDVG